MKSPEQIYQAIKDPKETRIGEEGVLRRVEIDGDDLYIKQWRGKHSDGDPYQENPYYAVDSEYSPVSPFWHKIKFYMHDIMREAFPDLIVAMPQAFDPRISKSGEKFDFETGRPITVTETVKTTPELQKKRDEITNPLYKVLKEREKVVTARGRLKKEGVSIFAGPATDSKIKQRFGEDILQKDPETTFEQFIVDANDIYPNSRVTSLLLTRPSNTSFSIPC